MHRVQRTVMVESWFISVRQLRPQHEFSRGIGYTAVLTNPCLSSIIGCKSLVASWCLVGFGVMLGIVSGNSQQTDSRLVCV